MSLSHELPRNARLQACGTRQPLKGMQRPRADDEPESLQSCMRCNSFDKLIIITLACRPSLGD